MWIFFIIIALLLLFFLRVSHKNYVVIHRQCPIINLFLYIQVITSPITVTIGLDWNVTSVGKPVPAAYTTQVNDGTVLVDVMNKAADEDTKGPFNKWASTYFGGLGHFITALDGVEQVRTNEWVVERSFQ